MKIEPERFYKLPEIQTILCVSLPTLRKWIRAGKLPAVKIGRFWFVKGCELQKITERGL